MNKELFKQILYGGIIGDAMGVPYEFKKQGEFIVIPDMVGFGTYNQKPGTWSDDTSLTLILMECLSKGLTPEDFLDKLKLYYHEGYMTPDNFCFDIGTTTLRALQRNPDKKSLGNGALMRAAPFAYTTMNMKPGIRRTEIARWSEITHPNNNSTECCIRYVEFLQQISKCGIFDFKQLKQKEVFTPCSSGLCIDSYLTALWALHEFNNYSDIILKIISLGGDTDTNAMIGGTLAATVYPINNEWYKKVRRKDIIDSILNTF